MLPIFYGVGLHMMCCNISGFLISTRELSLIAKNPQQIGFLLFGFHLWAWIVITVRCRSSHSTRSLSYCKWTFSTSNKLVVGFLLVIILINTTNIFKNHNLIFFYHGFFLATKKEMTTKIDKIKIKRAKKNFKKERKNRAWKFIDQLDIACVDKNSLFINYL